MGRSLFFFLSIKFIDHYKCVHLIQINISTSITLIKKLALAFNQPGHSIADMGLIPLELEPNLSTSRREAREAYLIDRGKTLSPDGLNRRIEH